MELAYQAITNQLIDMEKSKPSSIDTTSQATISHIRSENDRLTREIDNLRRNASSVSGGQSNAEWEMKVRNATNRVSEL